MSEHSGNPKLASHGARRTAPYGSWESPIATEMLTAGALRFDELDVDGDDLYWVESRPDEQGRYAAMRCSASGELSEVTTSDYSARTLVHEYGGGSFAVSNGVGYFSNFSDQRLYRRSVDGSDDPTPLTPEIPVRYADATVDDERGRLICVAEDHRREGLEAENYLASIPTDGSAADADNITRLHEGFDFCSSPRLSPGRSKAGLDLLESSQHALGTPPSSGLPRWPPTDRCSRQGRIAGDARGTVSITEPQWSPDGTLYCVSDESGWWNVHRWDGNQLVPVLPMQAEFSQPQWEFSMSTYAVLDECCIGAQYANADGHGIGVIDLENGRTQTNRDALQHLRFFSPQPSADESSALPPVPMSAPRSSPSTPTPARSRRFALPAAPTLIPRFFPQPKQSPIPPPAVAPRTPTTTPREIRSSRRPMASCRHWSPSSTADRPARRIPASISQSSTGRLEDSPSSTSTTAARPATAPPIDAI